MRLQAIQPSTNIIDMRDPSDFVHFAHTVESYNAEAMLAFGIGCCIMVAVWVIEFAVKRGIC